MNAVLPQTEIAQWNHLPDISETKPLDDNDRACLDAIRDVLARHACLDRFGVNLLHKHFEMDSDELLVEQVDEEGRRLVTKPVKLDLVRGELSTAYETQWQWQRNPAGELALVCIARCFPGNPQSPQHVNKHVGW
jgi:hypothetical protein